ncbi:MAG: hypothetical protein ACRDXX_10160 [Stackebrandtia sp.]
MTDPLEVSGWIVDLPALLEVADATDFAGTVDETARRLALTLLVPLPVLDEAWAGQQYPAQRDRLTRLYLPRGPWMPARYADVPTNRLVNHVRACGDDMPLGLVATLADLRAWPVVTSDDRRDRLSHAVPDLMTVPCN